MKKRFYFLSGFLLLLACSSLLMSAAYIEQSKVTTKEELGKKLFFDKLLSSDNSISCSSCHKPEFAFADTLDFSLGVGGQKTARNAPSVMNMKFREIFFWDGRAASLEEQALIPLENPAEMNLNRHEAVQRLLASSDYLNDFKRIYNDKPTVEYLADALASFERTLETSDTPFDLFAKGDSTAISASARRGQFIFNEKGHCFDCHFGPDFTGDEFKNIGLYNEKELSDAGRFANSKQAVDKGKFKVPGLRNVAVTAPYMHNGMFRTLREVIDYYSEPKQFVTGAINTDPITQNGFAFTEQEKLDLEAFLVSLTDTSIHVK